MASTAAPSSVVKNAHGPGCTGVGGVPAYGAQGKLPLTTNAWAEVPENSKPIAVVVISSRRRRPEPDGDEPGTVAAPTLSAPGNISPRGLGLSGTFFAAM